MPEIAFHKGEFMPLKDASVGVMTHALHYGTAVFEGIRGNWNQEHQSTYIFKLREHYERLLSGCKLMRIKVPYSVEQLCAITKELVEKCEYTQDVYIRPLAYKGAERVAYLDLSKLEDDGFTIVVVPLGDYLDTEKAVKCCTSSYRRMEDYIIPPHLKISGLYVNSILAKTEAIVAGFDEAILLNQLGHVSEGTGENIFIYRNGIVSTPPLIDNLLPGITRDCVFDILKNELGINVEERSIPRSELYLAEEIFLTGTAAHVTPVGYLDERSIGDGDVGSVTRSLSETYNSVIRGNHSEYMEWCTPVSLE